MSLLGVIDKVDTFPYDHIPGHYYHFLAHDGVCIGYMTKDMVVMFDGEPDFSVDNEAKTVAMGSHLTTIEARNEVCSSIASRWRRLPQFSLSLDKGWRDELYTVYNPSSTPYMLVERAFSVLLGIVTYGVHINGYVPASKSKDGKLKMWIPRRSATKSTFPGMLDNTVAGGLGYPYGISDTVTKECQEEAGLDAEFVQSHIKPTGVVSYMIQPDGPEHQVQPEVEYTFDLEFDDETSVLPFPEDGEAENFSLMTLDELLPKVMAGEFKPNCGLIIVDFLVRHGLVGPETPDYAEIVSRSHRRFPFPTL
ncbi:Uncharacterized protein JA9_002221 [Meyerozyma sp. JA9]|nr:Uncharacterized protein JA9_002221 [Meyerozyma sp. JA9]